MVIEELSHDRSDDASSSLLKCLLLFLTNMRLHLRMQQQQRNMQQSVVVAAVAELLHSTSSSSFSLLSS
eukprot:scaffold7697_cov172-Skeletonema_dohrnii-CCMP3373.AAC.2